MAFKRPTKSPQFADLKGILAQVKETENPLYQVVELILERLTQLKLVTPEEIEAAINKNKPTGPQLALPHAPTHMPGGNDVLPMTAASKLLGRGNTAPGPIEEITLGTGLDMSGTTLSASGSATPGPHAPTHKVNGTDPVDIKTLAGYPGQNFLFLTGNAAFTTIPPSAPIAHGSTHAAGGSDALPVSTAQRLLGRGAGVGGPVQELTINTNGFAFIGEELHVNNIPETAIADGALLARVAANEVISGTWTFQQTTPSIRFFETDGPADAKRWNLTASDGILFIETNNDAVTLGHNVIRFLRNGMAVYAIELYINNVLVTHWDNFGNLNHLKGINLAIGSYTQAASEGAFNPAGFGSVAVMAIYCTTSVNIHAMVNKAHGHVVTIHNRHISGGFIGIIHMEPTATPAWKIACPGAVNISMSPGSSVTFMWDGNVGNWIVIGKAL